jgi:hypothetical protein
MKARLFESSSHLNKFPKIHATFMLAFYAQNMLLLHLHNKTVEKRVTDET